jgi:hypothetical protein
MIVSFLVGQAASRFRRGEPEGRPMIVALVGTPIGFVQIGWF